MQQVLLFEKRHKAKNEPIYIIIYKNELFLTSMALEKGKKYTTSYTSILRLSYFS